MRQGRGWKGLLVALGVLGCGIVEASPKGSKSAGSTPPVLNHQVKDIDGKPVDLAKYKGKVLLIVNTASFCGNTPQYAKLEKLYTEYMDKGLEILAFPANNFGKQEPHDNATIKEFCTTKYNVTFPIFSKIEVKGPNQAPLYKYLTEETAPEIRGPVQWNFQKYLVSRDGKVVEKFSPGLDPTSPQVVQQIERNLGTK